MADHATQYPTGCKPSWAKCCEECCARLGGEKLVTHHGTIDDSIVLTTGADSRHAADLIAEKFRVDGAGFTRIFTDGFCGHTYRIVGHWT